MTQKIPNSLVTISKGAHREEVEGTELVGRASIKRLWQVFTTSRQASKDDTHRRLEYLFWRIWSSDHLTGQTDLQALDHLITRIMAAEPLHSTPIELPKASPQTIPGTQPNSEPIDQSAKPLHPILKKPNTVPGEPYHKSARLLLENPDGQKVTLGPSNSPPDKPAVTMKESPPARQTPKRPQFSAARAGKSGRRRPVFSRRKSSQASQSSREKRDAPESPSKQEHPENQKQVQESVQELVILNPADSFDPFFDAEDGVNADTTALPSHVPGSQHASQPASQGTSWTDSNVDPLTIKLALPIPPRPKNLLPPAEPTLVSTISTTPAPGPTSKVLAMSEKEDPVLSPGIETVSSQLFSQESSTRAPAKPMDPSSSSPKEPPRPSTPTLDPFMELDILNPPGAKRVHRPTPMMNNLTNVFRPAPAETTQAPRQLRTNTENLWHPFLRQDWPEQDETLAPQPQPSDTPLVEPGFRGRFLRFLESERAQETVERESDLRFVADDNTLEKRVERLENQIYGMNHVYEMLIRGELQAGSYYADYSDDAAGSGDNDEGGETGEKGEKGGEAEDEDKDKEEDNDDDLINELMCEKPT